MDSREEEVEAFCRRVQPPLVSLLALHCGRLELAEDIAQEALARSWQRWSTVSQAASPELWVYRVALNLSTSALRRRRLEQLPRRRVEIDHAPTDHADSLVVREAVARLPSRQRSAIVLRYFADGRTGHVGNCVDASTVTHRQTPVTQPPLRLPWPGEPAQ